MRLFLTCFIAFAMTMTAQVSLGRRAPGFSLPDVKLNQHDLQDYRGKVVLIDFMSTACPHCAELTKTLEQVKAKYGDKVVVLSVVKYPPENQNTVNQYAAANKATGPFLFDSGQMAASYLQVKSAAQTVKLPHLVIVDKQGMIRRDLAEEAANMANVTQAVDGLLK